METAILQSFITDFAVLTLKKKDAECFLLKSSQQREKWDTTASAFTQPAVWNKIILRILSICHNRQTS